MFEQANLLVPEKNVLQNTEFKGECLKRLEEWKCLLNKVIKILFINL